MKKIECVDAISTVTSNLKNVGEIYCISNILQGLWKYSKTGGIKELYSVQSYTDKLISHKSGLVVPIQGKKKKGKSQ
tara:strand:- start:78 stop:308 length:231 start_codon:yes stop_codon:yes gene_type:complete